MGKVFINIVLLIFPILMYLVFSCYNTLNNKKISRMVFIVTMFTSLYFSLNCILDNKGLLIFCNVPVLICYFKKEGLTGFIMSLIIIVFSYFIYNVNIYVVILKYLGYFMLYILLYKRKEFNYLYLKISAIIQGFFISFEYFMHNYSSVTDLIGVIWYIILIYTITFICLYLFKLADNISSLYSSVNRVKDESKIKNSLFKLTHEIKNPIAVCKGYLDMINLDDMNKSKKYINIIKSEIDRSLNVISDYMEYSKIKINKEIFDLVMLLDDIYESFEILAKSKNIKLNYDNNYEEIYLLGDYDRLKQVLVNVIKNSIEAIDSHGIINLSTIKRDKDILITITDNGIGMEKEELDNMKEMFYTTKKDGTGLGVALSNEIILAHNGKLTYDSKKNKGTKCTIELPL